MCARRQVQSAHTGDDSSHFGHPSAELPRFVHFPHHHRCDEYSSLLLSICQPAEVEKTLFVVCPDDDAGSTSSVDRNGMTHKLPSKLGIARLDTI